MTDTENQLIEQYKEDFRIKIGGMIEIKLLDKWDELCSFDKTCPFWKIVQMVTDATGWNPRDTFLKRSNEERVYRRQIIDLIAISNGRKLMEIGRETGRSHSTVIHSAREAKRDIEEVVFKRMLVREIMDFIKENYHLYKDKEITIADVII